MFDADDFALRCQAAATAADPIDAVQAVVAEAVRDGASIDARLGTEIRRDGDMLFASEHLTVLRILWPAGIWAQPHDHRVWAVIGVYSGEEFNRFFERAGDGLTEVDARTVGAGEVLALGAEVIHAVDNWHGALTGGLHVYGGDLSKVQRSAWGPDGLEAPFAENAAAQAAIFQAVRDVAHEDGITLDDAARYRLFRMLEAACVRERRYPTAVETRRMIDEAMNPESRVPPATG